MPIPIAAHLLACIVLIQPPYAGFRFWIPGGPEYTFFAENGEMVIRGARAGFAYTTKKYRNYELSYEWKFERPADLQNDADFKGDSGIFLHESRLVKDGSFGLTYKTMQWPRSVEVEGKYTEMGRLVPHEKVKGEFKDYPDARRQAMRPVGQWNTSLITCNEGRITVTINGKLMAEGQLAAEEKTNPWEGSVAFQAQGAEIHYRNIRIKEK
jgi:hypothetical protein